MRPESTEIPEVVIRVVTKPEPVQLTKAKRSCDQPSVGEPTHYNPCTARSDEMIGDLDARAELPFFEL